ncbi:pentapeptide repeat-containing protein, partial [Frankia sp. QA3]|uniref:pentapeptide repeat-containing protein n=1 Tax=Frankia sp. QA3 TaxID=710111 RepID=UPI0026F3D12C
MGRVGAADTSDSSVTVLHISDVQFGEHHVFGRAGLTLADRGEGSLFARLHDDLRVCAESAGLRPDLVVVTGDLAETGMPAEFAQVNRFLAELTDALGLGRDRVALVPGNHDVNWLACRAYVLGEQSEGREPQPPYWSKWRSFVGLLDEFHGPAGRVGFEVGAEWSLYEVPELRVVVAGLNSTMAETHEVHHGWLGEHQLRRVAEAMRRYERAGWLRLGAVHHNPIRGATADDENLRDADDLDRILGPHLNLLLHGHTHDGRGGWLSSSGLPVLSTGSAAVEASARPPDVPNQYQLIRIDRHGFTRHARRYEPDQKRWTGDLRIDPAGNTWSVPTRHRFREVHAAFPPTSADPADDDPHRAVRDPFDHEPRVRIGFRRYASGQLSFELYPAGETPPSAWTGADLLDEVAEVARLRHPGAVVDRVEDAEGLPAHLRIRRVDTRVVEQRVVGVIDGDADRAAVEGFAATVQARYLAAFPGLIADLVYTGSRPAPPDLVTEAGRRGVALLSMIEYQGVLDLRAYQERQTGRLLADQNYPPELYVAQRISPVRGAPLPVPVRDAPALDQIIDWLTTDQPRFVLLLGAFGHGKTYLSHELARELPRRLPHTHPLLIELRHLEKAPDLDRIVAQHLVASQVRRPDLDAFRYMLRTGQLVLIFDGFDELAARVTYDRAVAHLETLLAAFDDRGPVGTSAKIVVTSRAEFFLTDQDVLKETGRRVELTFGRFIIRLADFTDEQIHDYLVRRYLRGSRLGPAGVSPARGQEEAQRLAAARLALVRGVRDLPDLATNPRLLSFIADLDEERLASARRRAGVAAAGVAGTAGRVTAADLYRELLDQWLDYESERSRELTMAERRAAVTELAVTLWRDGSATVGVARLTEIAARVLETMSDRRGLTADETAQLLGSGTALRRDGEGQFSFIHQSVMEYLVAAEIADQLTGVPVGSGDGGPREPALVSVREMSELMADFLGDLLGRERAARWAQDVADAPDDAATTKANAVLLARRLGVELRTAARLAGADLSGQDLTGRDLRGADLRGANLTGAVLDRADLRDADLHGVALAGASLRETRLAGADLAEAALAGAQLHEVEGTPRDARGAVLDDARIVGGSLGAVRLAGASLRRAELVGTHLVGADLTRADLTSARLTDVDLTGATTAGSRWGRVAILGGLLPADPTGAAFAAAAIPGRDPAERMLRSASAPVLSVGFSPDGALLVSGGDDGSVRVREVGSGRELRVLTGHQGWVRSVGFSPDG